MVHYWYIYKIENIITFEKYIGLTNNIGSRWGNHILRPDNNFLRVSIDKYGIENFSFSVLERGIKSESEAKKRENYYTDFYQTIYPFGFNKCMNGGMKISSSLVLGEKIKANLKSKKLNLTWLSDTIGLPLIKLYSKINGRSFFLDDDLMFINFALGTEFKRA